MAMTVLSAILGLFSPIVFIVGAIPFSVHGTAPLKAVLAGSVAVALYLALCQFLVARNSAGRTRAVWSSSFVAMIAPVPIVFLAIAVGARRGSCCESRTVARRVPGKNHDAILVRQGFSVLSYDMRNRGLSGGDTVTFGSLEGPDIISAVHYLMTRPDIDPDRIGAMGLSLGAAATILAAAGDSRIKAVLDDSAFSDAPAAIRRIRALYRAAVISFRAADGVDCAAAYRNRFEPDTPGRRDCAH